MTDPLTIRPDRTALLIMDYQIGIVARIPSGAETALRQAATVLSAARHAGIPVIYVQLGFRRGYPEVSTRNRSFSAIYTRYLPNDPPARIFEVHPRPEQWNAYLGHAKMLRPAKWLGLTPGADGLVSWDVFDAVLTPGDIILLMSWRDHGTAERYESTLPLRDGASHA